jgi:flagellar hook assembly protein FlgD
MPIANGYDPSFRKFSFQSKELTLNMAIENFNLNNFPNPFSYETTITFDLPAKAEVLIKLFDMAGKEVGQIDNQEYNQGRNYVTWRTNKVQKGMYILKLFSNVGQATRVLSIVN